MSDPATILVRANDTHRLIPSRYSLGDASVLGRIAENDEDLAALFDLDGATNDRLVGQADLLPGIDARELLFGVPYASIVNAAFCHAHPLGSRFNGPERGAWYAARALRTAQAEVIFHKTVALAEIDRFEDSVTYDDYLADLGAELHDLTDRSAWADALAPDSYVESQRLAADLLAAGSMGIVYPSVRDRRGTCFAVFRPALVGNVRKDTTWRFTWDGKPGPLVTEENRDDAIAARRGATGLR